MYGKCAGEKVNPEYTKKFTTSSGTFGEMGKILEIWSPYICRVKVGLTATAELSCSFAARDFALVITGLCGAHVAFSTTIHPASDSALSLSLSLSLSHSLAGCSRRGIDIRDNRVCADVAAAPPPRSRTLCRR